MVKVNRDGDLLLTTGKDGVISLGYIDNGERIGTYDGHNGAVYAADITLDCQYLVSAGADGALMFWEVMTGEVIHKVKHGGIVKFCEWNTKPFEQNMVVTCNDGFKAEGVPARICVWKFDAENDDSELHLVIDDALPEKATKVKWGLADETLLSIHEKGLVMIWNSKTGAGVRKIAAHDGPVTDIQFTDDRMFYITASRDQTAKLWAAGEDFTEPVKVYQSDRSLNTAAISPCWANDEKKGELKKYHVMVGGGQEARDVTTTKDSSGKFEACLFHMIWEEMMGTVQGHFGPMNTLTFFADGAGFVSGGEDGYIRIHHFDQDYFGKKWD